MGIRRLALIGLLAPFVAILPAGAQEWTRFRGLNGAGESETIFPAEFSGSDFRWKVEIPGIGHASPVAWGEKLFTLSADPVTAERYVICLEAGTGKQLWVRSYASRPHHLHVRSSYASPTPAVDGQRVYVAWASPDETTLLALDHDGIEIWRSDLGPWVSQHGFGTSPMLYKQLVILHNSQQAERLPEGQKPGRTFMMAFDRQTGQQVWKTPLKTVRVNYSVPCVYSPPDGPDQLICCSTAEGVFSIDPETGKLNWDTRGALRMRTVGSPVVAGGLLFGSNGSGGGGNYLVAVRPGVRPEIAYEVRRSAPYVPTPVARGELLFLWYDKGIVTCIDPRTGKEYWRERVDGGYSGSPVRAGDKVYCISDEGELVCIAADRKFRQLGRTPLGEPSRATPAIHDGKMYLRTNSHVFCVDAKST